MRQLIAELADRVTMGKKSGAGAGKFVNPTDKARKEARKKELKKNKKQRLAVRTNVIKGKDPQQILADMRRLDRMEFNVDQAPALNEKVLTDKRRKLKDTWDRVMHLCQKEDKDRFVQLKRLQDEYEAERDQLKKDYEAIRSAQNVQLEEIPLPSLPTSIPDTSSSILKKVPSLTTYRSLTQKEAPGPPPGPPPLLSQFDLDSDDSESQKKVRFGSDNDVDAFLKEIEDYVPPAANPALSLPIAPVAPPAVIRTPLVLMRPPVPAQVPQPPTSAPTILSQPPATGPTGFSRPRPPVPSPDKNRHLTTIEAKPQLRNLSAAATRFTPLSLRVKRTEKKAVARPAAAGSDSSSSSSAGPGSGAGDGRQSKEAAYEQFMRELQGLL